MRWMSGWQSGRSCKVSSLFRIPGYLNGSSLPPSCQVHLQLHSHAGIRTGTCPGVLHGGKKSASSCIESAHFSWMCSRISSVYPNSIKKESFPGFRRRTTWPGGFFDGIVGGLHRRPARQADLSTGPLHDARGLTPPPPASGLPAGAGRSGSRPGTRVRRISSRACTMPSCSIHQNDQARMAISNVSRGKRQVE